MAKSLNSSNPRSRNMIKLEFTEPDSPEWTDWRKRCAEAATALLNQWKPGKKLDFNGKLYSEMKALMKEKFHGKCAYCEAKVELDQHGDVEHFRPKAAVTDDDFKPIMVQDAAGNSFPHPGYFWLAYEYTNLLLSCELCNQPSSDKQGSKLGKRNRFPLQTPPGYAVNPQDVGAERPLLLNPLNDDPSKHFQFDPDTGRLIPLTPEGRKCVEVFDLNDREGLAKVRLDIYINVLGSCQKAIEARDEDNAKKLDQNLDQILRHKRGEAFYSFAGRAAIAKHKANMAAHLAEI